MYKRSVDDILKLALEISPCVLLSGARQVGKSTLCLSLDREYRVTGGYLEILKIDSAKGRSLWFNAYISTYVERDIRDVGELRDISAFIRFYNIIAPRSCGLVNKSDLANEANLSEATVNNYLSMLEMIYQISLLQPFASNISKRFIKSSKMFMTDSGLFCHLLDINNVDELLNSTHKSDVVETFVYAELLKHIGYSQAQAKIYHYRTNDKKEIDFILEKGNKIFAIEVKSSKSIKKDAFKHIEDLQKKSDKEVIGIVFYTGDDMLPFGDESNARFALPLSLFF